MTYFIINNDAGWNVLDYSSFFPGVSDRFIND